MAIFNSYVSLPEGISKVWDWLIDDNDDNVDDNDASIVMIISI
jgi:hypothetical protein